MDMIIREIASINKLFIESYEELKELLNYANNTTFICPNGQKLNLIDYVEPIGMSEQEIKKFFLDNKVVITTGQSINYFLIKYCPLEFIQKQLKDNCKEYDSIKNGISKYDTFVRPKGGKHLKFSTKPKAPFKFSNSSYKQRTYVIEAKLNNKTLWYNEDYDSWLLPNELGEYYSYTAEVCHSYKALVRKVLKWELPIDTVLTIHNGLEQHKLVIKK